MSGSTSTTTKENEANHLAERLSKDIIDHKQIPDTERCLDLLKDLKGLEVNMALLEATKLGKLLGKATKTLKRHQRTAPEDVTQDLQTVIETSSKLLEQWKKTADKEAKSQSKKKQQPDTDTSREGLPKTQAEYRARLVKHNKEMYKDPPAVPPGKVEIESETCPAPKRDKKSGELTFVAGEGTGIQSALKEFHPNRTPEEVLRAGSFGGTYFRPIMSSVTNVHYTAQEVVKDTLPKEWIEGIPMSSLTSASYKQSVNKYGVKCGGSLGMWESSGWIADSDPYGWFQWYCRFYQGRRCSDDARQISRWLKSAGPKGRFRSQLCNKILAANTTHDDKSISPVIRQTLLHWGLEITPEVLEKHRKRVGK